MIKIDNDADITISYAPELDYWIIRFKFSYFGKEKTLSIKATSKFMLDLYKALRFFVFNYAYY